MTSRTICVGKKITDAPMITAQFVQKACEFSSDVMIEIENEKFINGKSLMGMLSLSVHEGMELRIVSNGADEEEAAKALGNLLGEIAA